jgi:hypothetical protein
VVIGIFDLRYRLGAFPLHVILRGYAGGHVSFGLHQGCRWAYELKSSLLLRMACSIESLRMVSAAPTKLRPCERMALLSPVGPEEHWLRLRASLSVRPLVRGNCLRLPRARNGRARKGKSRGESSGEVHFVCRTIVYCWCDRPSLSTWVAPSYMQFLRSLQAPSDRSSKSFSREHVISCLGSCQGGCIDVLDAPSR